MPPMIMWFRRDLRLTDNPALCAAIAEAGGDDTYPVFVLDPRLLESAGAARRAFLAGCVEALDDSLDGRLTIVAGHPAEEIPKLAKKVKADAVMTAADFGPYGRERDEAVDQALEADGRRLVGLRHSLRRSAGHGALQERRSVQGLHAVLPGVAGS